MGLFPVLLHKVNETLLALRTFLNPRILAYLSALGATVIYGLNHTIAKVVMPQYIQPFGFILLRVMGASAIFWLISLAYPQEKIDRKDWKIFVLGAVLGMVINMLAFFKGLSLSTPIQSSLLVTMTPIIVVAMSALLLKEQVGWVKTTGIALGFGGAMTLVAYGADFSEDAALVGRGNLLLLINSISFGGYLIVTKKIIHKYKPITYLKWLFTIATVINAPLCFQELSEVSWNTLPLWAIGSMTFVVVGTTCMTYLFNAYALTQLKASSVSTFTYIQPLVGILFALAVGQDQMTEVKALAGAMVVVGVYLATKKQKEPKKSR